MNEGLSTALVLRLRGNAASLHRAAEKSRAILQAPIAQETAPDLDPEQEQALIADLARTKRRIAEANAIAPKPAPTATPPASTPKAATPEPAPPQPAPSQPAKPPTPEETASRTAWATAMSDVAREFTDGLANLPPVERRQATMRATALNSVAQHLLSNAPLPPSILRP